MRPVHVLLGILSGKSVLLNGFCAEQKLLKICCVRVVIVHYVIIFSVFMLVVSHYMHYLCLSNWPYGCCVSISILKK